MSRPRRDAEAPTAADLDHAGRNPGTLALVSGFLLPGPFRSLAMLPVFLAMPWAIRAANRRQDELRWDEQGVGTSSDS